MDDKIEIYRRPKESPALVCDPMDIRVNYRGHWIDCRKGLIRIMSPEGMVLHRRFVQEAAR